MTLPSLLSDRLTAKGWQITDLHAEVVRLGCAVSYSAVHGWCTGRAGIHDRHKPAVARALGVSLGDLAAAAAGGVSFPDSAAVA